MKNVYFILFYCINSFWKAISDDDWSEWKTLLVIIVLNGFLLLSVDIYASAIFGISIIMELPRLNFIIVFFVFSIMHYFLFLHNERWKKRNINYKSIASKNYVWLAVCLFIILIIFNLIISFYQLSKSN